MTLPGTVVDANAVSFVRRALLRRLHASMGESHRGAAVVVSLVSLVPVVWIGFQYLEQSWLCSGSGSTLIATSRLGRASR